MIEFIDINLARGAVLILLVAAFIGIWAWAWSNKRKAEFDAARMLPLDEDDGSVPQHQNPSDRKNLGTKE